MKYYVFFLITCFLAGVHSASASVLDVFESRDWKSANDDLITFDKVSGYEWLDLTQTRNTSWKDLTGLTNSCNPTCSTGGYEGWTFAERSNVEQLFVSAFGNTWFLIDRPDPLYGEVQLFTDLIGVTGDLVGWTAAWGITHTRIDSLNIEAPWVGFTSSQARTFDDRATDSSGGSFRGAWLYRDPTVIPLPPTLLLFATAFGILVFFSCRNRIQC